MSFILDALKKAEAERQRQSGPTLLEVRVSSPRRRLPLWTMVLGVLLAINMILLLIFALHKPAPALGTAPAAGTASAPEPARAAAAAASTTIAAPAASAADTSAAVIAAVPAPAPVASALGADGAENPADNQPAVAGTGAGAGSSAEPDTASINPVDLPSLAELGADLPDLRLDLQVYSERRADRYALINMHKVHEGDMLPEGPRVLQIFPNGVALSYRGNQFMLRPQ
jgi:general secretion pathway protein B